MKRKGWTVDWAGNRCKQVISMIWMSTQTKRKAKGTGRFSRWATNITDVASESAGIEENGTDSAMPKRPEIRSFTSGWCWYSAWLDNLHGCVDCTLWLH